MLMIATSDPPLGMKERAGGGVSAATAKYSPDLTAMAAAD